jgi:hypothetical protein
MTANGSDGTIFVSSGGQYAKDAEAAPQVWYFLLMII